MEQNLLSSPLYSSLRTAETQPAGELVPRDLIFMHDLGLVPKHFVRSSNPSRRPAAERKWLGADFSHVIVSQ
jgi:hypothetical protein